MKHLVYLLLLLTVPLCSFLYSCGGSDSNAQNKNDLFIIERQAITFNCPTTGQIGALECPADSIIVGAGCDVDTITNGVEYTVVPIITSQFVGAFTITQANNCDIDCSNSPIAGDVQVKSYAVCLDLS